MLAAGRGSIVNVFRGRSAWQCLRHRVHSVEARRHRPHPQRGFHVRTAGNPRECRRTGGVATGIPMPATPSEFGSGRLAAFLNLIPPVATAEQLAASITFLLSDDGVNINGAILPSDGGWSTQ